MSKSLKNMLSGYLKNRFDAVDSACVVDLSGMDVATTEKLRTAMRAKSGRVEVVKNRVARQAFADTPLKALGEVLQGPCALVTSEESIIDIAKALVTFAKEHKRPALKEAILEGDPDLFSVTELSKMKSRLEIIGEVAGLAVSPGRRLAGCIAGPQSRIAGCLKAIADKG